MESEAVANIDEPDGVGELGVEEADDVTPWGKSPRFLVHPVFSGKTADEMRRNKLAELSQDTEL